MTRVIWADRAATAVLWGIAFFVIGILLAIIGHFLLASIGTLSLSFIFGDPSDSTIGGVGPVLFNSIYILTLTLLLTVPLGILGGIYMAEYAGEGRLTTIIRFSQELISSVPSIVVGMFGLALFVTLTHWSFTALGGSLALLVFNLPLLTRLTEQAIRAVPADERRGSIALGVSKWRTIRHVVVPIAIPGIVTGIILTAGRIFGEAAALIFTSGLSTPSGYNFANLNITDPRSPWSPFHSATTLSVFIWKSNSEGLGLFVHQVADASSAVLVLMVLVFNLGARGLGRYLQRRVTGT
ncbi:MAG TPA: phosphate ABC transporter permease PstA [Candidatus Limnocylindrales bacterium]|nr:phosphate ABC transporter permease PstA [Candidatus Limnocylindrales bacterium]